MTRATELESCNATTPFTDCAHTTSGGMCALLAAAKRGNDNSPSQAALAAL